MAICAGQDVVLGTASVDYLCSTTGDVDRHLAWLTQRLDYAHGRFPKLAAIYRADIDLLLDKRSQLTSED